MISVLLRSFFSLRIWLPCLLVQAVGSLSLQAQQITASLRGYQVPVLKENASTAVMRVQLTVPAGPKAMWLEAMTLDFSGSSDLKDINGISVYSSQADSGFLTAEKKLKTARFASSTAASDALLLRGNMRLQPGLNQLWIDLSVCQSVNLLHQITVRIKDLTVDGKKITVPSTTAHVLRLGSAVRSLWQDNVHTSRIPGMATAPNGDLLVIFDARYESARDLQGDIDIGLNRSSDRGASWQPLQVVLDKGTWGQLPEKFNGVSDPCILVDKKSGTIYVAGLWMHGVLDSNGRWTEGLTDTSKNWNHQWRDKGSQPGFDPKQTAQFLLTKSTDNGKTWSSPVNLTTQCKRPEWWLWAPAPGSGIVLRDGTLLFPTQGRDATGKAFSNITYSRDGGKTWASSNPALPASTTECMAVELSDGSIMLNMRTNANRGVVGEGNGRSVAVTRDLGQTWTEHPTSRKALIEPVCMASLFRHDYMRNGKKQSVLLFLNPHSYTKRDHITLQVSTDDGMTWPSEKHILLDELSGRGYSCITSIDENTIGVLYEGSQAQLIFQQLSIKDIIE